MNSAIVEYSARQLALILLAALVLGVVLGVGVVTILKWMI